MATHDEKVIKLPNVDSNKNKICEMYGKVIQSVQKPCHYQKLHTRSAFLRTIDAQSGSSTIKPVVVHQLFETSILIDSLNSSMFTTEREQIMTGAIPYFTSKSKSVNYSADDFAWLEE